MPNKADKKKINQHLVELKKYQSALDDLKGEWEDAIEETKSEEKQAEIQEDIDAMEEALGPLDDCISELEELVK